MPKRLNHAFSASLKQTFQMSFIVDTTGYKIAHKLTKVVKILVQVYI